MSSSNSRSFSPSQRTSNRNFNLQYEPALYCKCGLKSPLCTARESGRKFFGCQQWKENGCGFFVFLEDLILNGELEGMQGMQAMECGSAKIGIDELKHMIQGLRDDMSVVRTELEKINLKMDSGEIHRANGMKMVKAVAVVVVVGLGMFVWMLKNKLNQDKPTFHYLL